MHFFLFVCFFCPYMFWGTVTSQQCRPLSLLFLSGDFSQGILNYLNYWRLIYDNTKFWVTTEETRIHRKLSPRCYVNRGSFTAARLLQDRCSKEGFMMCEFEGVRNFILFCCLLRHREQSWLKLSGVQGWSIKALCP